MCTLKTYQLLPVLKKQKQKLEKIIKRIIIQFVTKQSVRWAQTASHCGFPLFTVGQSRVKPPPRVEGLPRPDPEARGDAHNERHEIFYHEDSEVRTHTGVALGWTWHCICLACQADPGFLPMLSESLLIEVAGDDNTGRHRIKHAEDPYPYHQLLQLLGLGAIVLHDGPNAKQGYEARQKERSSDEQINKQRRQDKAPQGIHTVDAHKANPTQHISVHLTDS